MRAVNPIGQSVDRLDVRRHNLSLVLRQVSSAGVHSRASVAADIGLTRATVSSLVDDLIRRGLVKEVGHADAPRMGRPATILEPDGSKVVAIGIEIDVAKVPQRETGMTPYEIMLSESQERMLLVVKRGREKANRWIGQRMSDPELEFAKIAEANGAIGIGPIKTVSDVKAAIEKGVAALKAGKVCLIDCWIDPTEERSAQSSLEVRVTE